MSCSWPLASLTVPCARRPLFLRRRRNAFHGDALEDRHGPQGRRDAQYREETLDGRLGASNPHDFLGVERSVRGSRWELAEADERAGLAIAQRFSLPEIVGRLMAARASA
jgi:single-stranded-DNA-specific exonuclease